MNRLFEAKARFAGEYVLYNIYRVAPDKYEAQLIQDENTESNADVPSLLLVTREDGQWRTNDEAYHELGSTLGIEIDAFNSGYGELLGRIGVR